jgi:hypothetical protein
MYGTVMKSHSSNEWEVKFDNGTTNILKSNQIRLTKGLNGTQSKQQHDHQLHPTETSTFSNLLSPLSQNTIEKEMVLDGDDDDSNDNNEYKNLPVLASKNTSKKVVVSSDATAKNTRRYIDDSSSDESYCDDDNSDDDSDDGSYNDDDDDDNDDDIDDDVDDMLLIEDNDDDDKLLPIHYFQLSEHDQKLWNAKRKVQG